MGRTAKGTASTKTATTQATLSSVSVKQGTLIVVAVAYDPTDGNPTVKVGREVMRLVPGSMISNVGTDMRLAVYRKRIDRTNTRNITVNWATSTANKVVCIIAVELTDVGKKDVGHTRAQDAVTDPSSSTPANAPDSTVADTIQLCFFASHGPDLDTAGTAGSGHTLGQRVGTSGGGPLTNITLQETYEILTATGEVRGSLTGATSRDWATSVVAFKGTAYKVTVGSAYHYTPKAYPHMESAILDLEDSGANVVTRVRVPAALWDILTTTQKEDYIKHCAQWAADEEDGELDVVETDTALETDLASFEGNTYTV